MTTSRRKVLPVALDALSSHASQSKSTAAAPANDHARREFSLTAGNTIIATSARMNATGRASARRGPSSNTVAGARVTGAAAGIAAFFAVVAAARDRLAFALRRLRPRAVRLTSMTASGLQSRALAH